MLSLGYSKWGNFKKVIDKAKIACNISNNNVAEHFADAGKVLEVGNRAKMNVIDYHLSRYACYLIVQNANPSKEIVALGQTYFAIQTNEVLKNRHVDNEDDACKTHHAVGQAVRQTIKKIGGTMPEKLPTPEKSIKELEKEELKEIAN